MWQVIGDLLNDLGIIVQNIIRQATYVLSSILYGSIKNLYNVFDTICKVKLLNINFIEDIAQRIGLILGLIMFLIVAFSFIQIILDPSKISDPEKGINGIIKKVIIVIVLLGSYSYIFTLLDNIQDNLIESGIFQKILLPSGYTFDSENFGGILSAELFTSFYSVSNEAIETGEAQDCINEVNNLKTEIVTNDNFPIGTCLNKTYDNNSKYVMSYNWLFLIGVGLFVAYIILMYTISVGTRAVQLAFLQMISPAAIIGYLSPKKDNVFTKWWKMYISTYVDVFVRIAIINVSVFLVSIVIDAWNEQSIASGTFQSSIGELSGIGGAVAGIYIRVILIIAILSFAKKAPELLKDLLPGNGASKLGFGIGMKDKPGIGMLGATTAALASRGIGGAVGRLKHIKKNWNDEDGNPRSALQRASLIAGGIGGTLLGSAGGVISGIRSGKIGETWRNQQAKNQKFNQWSEDGGVSSLERIGDRILGNVGMNKGARLEREKKKIEAKNSVYDQIQKNFSSMEDRAKSKINDGKFSGNEHAKNVISLKQKMSMYQAQLDKLDPSDGSQANQDKIKALQISFNEAQADYNKEMDEAVKAYIDGAINGSGDAVIKQQCNETQALINNNSSYFTDAAGYSTSTVDANGHTVQFTPSTNDYATFKATSDNAGAAISNNNIQLQNNAAIGKSARANDQYNNNSNK